MINDNHFNPYGDMPEIPGLNDPNITYNERQLMAILTGCCGCFSMLIAFLLLLLLLCALGSSCTPQRIVTDTLYQHRAAEMVQRVDSLLHLNTVAEHDSAWRQEILRQFLSVRESSDTSRTLVVDTAGRVVTERLVINNVRETTSATDREERLVMMHRLEVIDSTLRLMEQRVEHSDSLLQSKQTAREVAVEKPLTRWQQVRMRIGEFWIVVSLMVIAVWLMKKRSWWLRMFK